jgi:hypothetical protein
LKGATPSSGEVWYWNELATATSRSVAALPEKRAPMGLEHAPEAVAAKATSSRVPHVSHWGHRPNHFAVMCLHSEQQY